MALKGTLKDFSLADIFQLISIQKKTGILSLKRDDEQIDVYFEDGMIVWAEAKSERADLLLGKLLVRIGAITKQELEEALETQKNTMKRLGQILIDKHYISQEDLREALRKKVLELVYSLFKWRRGDYHFTPLTKVDYDRENFEPLSTESVLMEGLRMIDEWPVIERKLNKPDLVFRKKAKSKNKAKEIDAFLVEEEFLTDEGKESLPYEMGYVLGLVDGMSSIRDIVEKSKLIEFYTYRALYDLLEGGYIEPTVITAPDLPVKESKKKIASEKVLFAGIVIGVVFVITFWASFKSPINDVLPSFNPLKGSGFEKVNNEYEKLKAVKSREIIRLLNFSFSMKPEAFLRTGEFTYTVPGKYGLYLPVSFYSNESLSPQANLTENEN